MRLSPTVTGGLFALTVAACSGDRTATGTSAASASQLDMDAAMVAGDAVAQDVEVMHGPAGPRFGIGLLRNPARFDCGTQTRGGITVTRECVFKDAAGNVQSAYDSLTTASVTVNATIEGTFDHGHLSGTVARTSSLVVTGLEGNESSRTWNGSGNGTSTRVRTKSDGSTRSYELTESFTVVNVVIPVPRAGSWPTSGTITRSMTLKRPDGSIVQRTVTITFDGTSTAQIVVNSERFGFDLAERAVWRRSGG